MKAVICQFIPIIFIFLFLTESTRVKKFSRTIWGKMVVVGLIVFYASVDKYVGALVCGIVILYFQNENIEPMEVLGYDIDFYPSEFNHNDDNMNGIEIDERGLLSVDDGYYIEPPINSPPNKLKRTKVSESNKKILSLNTPKSDNLEDEFRVKNCDKGVLKYKNMKVKNEMAEHVFPEMKYDTVLCNPCTKACDISITENKLATESKVQARPSTHF
jgi:hypothetical protein